MCIRDSSRSCVELATYIFEKMAYDYTKIALDIPDKQISKWRKYSKMCIRDSYKSVYNSL